MQVRALGWRDEPEYRTLELLASKTAMRGSDAITDPFAFAVLFPPFEKAPLKPYKHA